MRVIRVLIYEGNVSLIDQTMRQNAVKNYHEIKGPQGEMRIYETIVGYDYPKATGTTWREATPRKEGESS